MAERCERYDVQESSAEKCHGNGVIVEYYWVN